MLIIRGTGVSGGIAAGPLYFFHPAVSKPQRFKPADREAEWQRFKAAQAKTIEALGALVETTRRTAGDQAAQVFETHQMMCEDPDFEAAVESSVKEQGLNAEAAVEEAEARLSEGFSTMDNDYFRDRAADIKDISNRIINILSGTESGAIDSDVPVILAADDLAPNETAQLDRSKVLGFVISGGSPTNHTSILIRAMGIPAVIGVGDSLKNAPAGHPAILDGSDGTVIVDADKATQKKLMKKQEELFSRQSLLKELKGKPAITKDGQEIRICCNIRGPEDVSAVLENDADGVGLLRSEFLYLGRDDFPSEDMQIDAYRKVLSGMGDKEVIIRTMDIGADKNAACFRLPHEENPALGNRALRICLSRPEIFRTQLRALYRSSVFGHLSIMFPMVASVWEVVEARNLCDQVKAELKKEGIPFSDHVPIGIMIETPAAAMISDRLAKVSDFFSIGTNDLTQYTLACDRQNSELGRFFNPYHPAVLRLVKMVCENAHREGIRCDICGELAADLSLTEFFLSVGMDELSVSPQAVLPLKQKVRDTEILPAREQLLAGLMSDRPEQELPV